MVPADKSDIFSLGCVLFEALTGKHLIERGSSRNELLLNNKKVTTAILLKRLEQELG